MFISVMLSWYLEYKEMLKSYMYLKFISKKRNKMPIVESSSF